MTPRYVIIDFIIRVILFIIFSFILSDNLLYVIVLFMYSILYIFALLNISVYECFDFYKIDKKRNKTQAIINNNGELFSKDGRNKILETYSKYDVKIEQAMDDSIVNVFVKNQKSLIFGERKSVSKLDFSQSEDFEFIFEARRIPEFKGLVTYPVKLKKTFCFFCSIYLFSVSIYYLLHFKMFPPIWMWIIRIILIVTNILMLYFFSECSEKRTRIKLNTKCQKFSKAISGNSFKPLLSEDLEYEKIKLEKAHSVLRKELKDYATQSSFVLALAVSACINISLNNSLASLVNKWHQLLYDVLQSVMEGNYEILVSSRNDIMAFLILICCLLSVLGFVLIMINGSALDRTYEHLPEEFKEARDKIKSTLILTRIVRNIALAFSVIALFLALFMINTIIGISACIVFIIINLSFVITNKIPSKKLREMLAFNGTIDKKLQKSKYDSEFIPMEKDDSFDDIYA